MLIRIGDKQINIFFDQYGNIYFRYGDKKYQLYIEYDGKSNEELLNVFKESEKTQFEDNDCKVGEIEYKGSEFSEKIINDIEEKYANGNEVDENNLNYYFYMKSFPERTKMTELFDGYIDDNQIIFHKNKDSKNIEIKKRIHEDGNENTYTQCDGRYDDNDNDNVTYDCFVFENKYEEYNYENCYFSTKTSGYPCYSICVYNDGIVTMRKIDKTIKSVFSLNIINEEIIICKK